MKNRTVKKALFDCEVKQCELAQALNMHEQTLSRKLQRDLSSDEQKKMVEVIRWIAQNRK